MRLRAAWLGPDAPACAGSPGVGRPRVDSTGVELPVIRHLVADGVLVVAASGGGIPVTRGPDGKMYGVDVAYDEELAA